MTAQGVFSRFMEHQDARDHGHLEREHHQQHDPESDGIPTAEPEAGEPVSQRGQDQQLPRGDGGGIEQGITEIIQDGLVGDHHPVVLHQGDHVRDYFDLHGGSAGVVIPGIQIGNDFSRREQGVQERDYDWQEDQQGSQTDGQAGSEPEFPEFFHRPAPLLIDLVGRTLLQEEQDPENDQHDYGKGIGRGIPR